jgi:segregation and condensation protein A
MGTMENPYRIKAGSFEGPFSLLLSLIEERKLHINDISLSQVTEDYLGYVNSLESKDPREITSFIFVAATLILIKSKSLLPNLPLTDEEEGDIKNLEERLRLYELYTRLGGNLKKIFGKKMIFYPQERKSDLLVFLPDEQITRESMMTFAEDALSRAPKKIILSEVKKVVSIEEMIDKLTERIQNSLKLNFKDFSMPKTGKQSNDLSKEEKVIVIVSFLAMLELARQGILKVAQENNFEDIMIEKFTSLEVEEELEIN